MVIALEQAYGVRERASAAGSDLSEDLISRANAGLDRTVEESLVVDGRVLSGEVDAPFGGRGDPTIRRVLPNLVEGVSALDPRIFGPVILVRRSRECSASAREDGLDVVEEPVGVLRRRRSVRSAS